MKQKISGNERSQGRYPEAYIHNGRCAGQGPIQAERRQGQEKLSETKRALRTGNHNRTGNAHRTGMRTQDNILCTAKGGGVASVFQMIQDQSHLRRKGTSNAEACQLEGYAGRPSQLAIMCGLTSRLLLGPCWLLVPPSPYSFLNSPHLFCGWNDLLEREKPLFS